MRLIFGPLISILIVCYYGVESVELRCPCGSNSVNKPVSGVFLIGRDPPNPPGCNRFQYYLAPPHGKPVCLDSEHHISKWLDGQNSNSWYKVIIKNGDDNKPKVEKRTEIRKRFKWN
uniref:Alpha-chemokine UL146 n=1 Tax=Human cytomegalovirus TaxID=10359 RepID=B5L778_HCMV|nr:alpha-chemokine UL146 [Human betaherpesvirus 5]